MKRIIFIDIAKAICIVLVVIGHYVPDNSPAWYVAFHDIIYTFHMPLFMFTSGYVYIATKKDISYGQFILKKIKTPDGTVFYNIHHCYIYKDFNRREHEC